MVLPFPWLILYLPEIWRPFGYWSAHCGERCRACQRKVLMPGSLCPVGLAEKQMRLDLFSDHQLCLCVGERERGGGRQEWGKREKDVKNSGFRFYFRMLKIWDPQTKRRLACKHVHKLLLSVVWPQILLSSCTKNNKKNNNALLPTNESLHLAHAF